MSLREKALFSWRWFVDLCSAWIGLKLIFSFLAGVAVWMYGYVENIPGPYLVVLSLLMVAIVLAIWNLLSFRLVAFHGRNAMSFSGPPKQVATESELSAGTICNRRFRLIDVPRDRGMLHSKVFEDCHIEGPSVIYLGGGSFDDCGFVCPPSEPNAITIEVADGRTLMGVIGMDNCVLRRCVLDGIAFCGKRSLMNQFRTIMQQAPVIS